MTTDIESHYRIQYRRYNIQSDDPFFFPPLSINGATKTERTMSGKTPQISTNADKNVDPVSSNTKRLIGRFMASPPTAVKMVAMAILVKSFVQSVFAGVTCFSLISCFVV